ncbi:Zinc finger, C2H2 [Phytophthora cinnamomi]|uniref:Zinc finger, C2H2 n=1 Tax=Phytophthora cinnamomi TaxID=4785 RepID=UPI00355ABE24|nr:Zinc finger, C2H2 [Phytophthora cinnamomi]
MTKAWKPRKVSEKRSYAPHNDAPEPNAADLAAGIVSPLDVPVDGRIPYLRFKNVRGRRHMLEAMRATRRRNNRLIMELGGFQYEVHRTAARLGKNKRRKSHTGLPVNDKAPLEDAPKLQDMDEELLVRRNKSVVCKLTCCEYLRRYGSSTSGLQPYGCINHECKMKFECVTELFEHQLQVHGMLIPAASRIVADVFHQQRGKLAHPPPTVYLGQQYMQPGRPPTPWKSLDEVHEEARDMKRRLKTYKKNRGDHGFIWGLFDQGYQKVKRLGQPELERQYVLAMEHFHSAYKFPTLSRGFHDGCPSVGHGRNWLTSTEREDARYLHPFSLNDKVVPEPEFVLIDTQRDEEMNEELSDGSDAEEEEDASVSEVKVFKLDDDDDDEEMTSGDFKERKVFEVDSDDDSDGDATVKSESVQSDAESKPSVANVSASEEEEEQKLEEDSASKRPTTRGDRKDVQRDSDGSRDAEDDTERNSSVSDSDGDDEADSDDDDEIFNQLE